MAGSRGPTVIKGRVNTRALEGSSVLEVAVRTKVNVSVAIRPKEKSRMSMQNHLAELERRHHALELEINEAQKHPSCDDLEIIELKRHKLLVKDEIARLL